MKRFLTFDDIGLIPKFNRITSRLQTNICTRLGKDTFKSPFIPANMDSVICLNLARVCNKRGAPIIFHRFAPLEEQKQWIQEFPNAYLSVGVSNTNKQEIQELYDAGCRRFCIDVAHGHCKAVLDKIQEIKELDKENQVIAGNICTGDGLVDLAKAGADIVKVGVGPGAACITRMMTGVGVPQFSAIQECVEANNSIMKDMYNTKVGIIADGGIKHPRDAVLSLAAGANAVMMGSIFARTFESAAPKREKNGKVYGRYRGQASTEFMEEFFGESKKRHPEGVAFDVEITQSTEDVFNYYEGGLRSSLTYLGSENLEEFQKESEFFETSGNYMFESNYRK